MNLDWTFEHITVIVLLVCRRRMIRDHVYLHPHERKTVVAACRYCAEFVGVVRGFQAEHQLKCEAGESLAILQEDLFLSTTLS